MDLKDAVVVYDAESNLEAHFLEKMLAEAGVKAGVTEDVSLVGVFHGGALPGLHKPQVWVSRADLERAEQILAEYDRQLVERRRAAFEPLQPEQTIAIGMCDKCGQRTPFPAKLLGSVQTCRHCGAYVDVGDEAAPEDMFGAEGGSADEAPQVP